MVSVFVLVGLLLASSFSFSQACTVGLFENIDFPGTDITFLYAASVENCQKLCTQHPSCLFFTFIRPDWNRDNRHFYCYLKSNLSGNPASQTPLNGVTSGFSLKSCKSDIHQSQSDAAKPSGLTHCASEDGPCFFNAFENVDFPGADYKTLVTPNHEECQRVCTHDPGCAFFTFITAAHENQTDRYKCHLKFSWQVPRPPIIERKTGVTSGFAKRSMPIQPSADNCPEQLFQNTDIPGYDIEQVKSISPEYCQILCSAHPQCTYFSFTSSDFNCYLKNNPNGLTTTRKTGVTSGISARFCNFDDYLLSQLFEGVDFRGSDIRYELLQDEQECQQKCDEDPNCQFYTYVNGPFYDRNFRRRCYLKRSITMPAPPKVTKKNNVVSGFRLRNWRHVIV